MNQEKLSQFQQLKQNRSIHSPQLLMAFFDSLAQVAPETLSGRWRGGLLASGHPGEQQLKRMNWVGKEFVSPDEVYPILIEREDGDIAVSELLGQASIREVCYRGLVSSCMIYDNHPTFDYFRQITPQTLMGVMENKGDAQQLFFYLEKS